MKYFRVIFALLSIPVMVILDSCSSGKAAYEQGNYYESVMTSVSRLRRNTDHKKSVETLRQAYPLAVRYYEDQANNVLASNNEFKWTSVVQSYTMINMMYDEIKRSPGAMAVIPNPVNYHNKLDEAKRNAAEENYQAGILALSVGSRDKAKQAYGLFKRANDFVVGYKEVNNYMEQALFAATVKVLITPVPATRNVAWSAEFFNDKISEFLHTASINEFVRFYTVSEAQTLKLNPDHVIELTFDEFTVGQVSLHEKQIQLEKDSVVMGTYIAPTTQVAANTNTSSNIQNQNNTGTSSNVSNPTSGNTSSNVLPNTGNNTNNAGNTSSANQSNTGAGVQNNQAQNTPNNNSQNVQSNQNNPSNSGNQNTQGNNNNGNQTPQETNEEKVTVCHKPPGNTTNTQTLIIPMSAVQAHLDHGDALGFCDDSKGNNNKPAGNKNNNSKGASGAGYGSLIQKNHEQILLASNETKAWMFGIADEPATSDTVTIYGKVKATYYHYQKTTTSKGIVSFRIVDAKTKGILSAEKMPGQYVWISEWATFNGDERALTPLQLEIAKQRERVPPPAQDLFIEFTKPIYTQITGKIQNFYKGY